MYYTLYRGDLLLVVTIFDKLDKDSQDCIDAGAEPEDYTIAVNDRCDDSIDVSLCYLSGCFTHVQL